LPPGDKTETRIVAACALVLNNHPRPDHFDEDRAVARGIVARLVLEALERNPDKAGWGIYVPYIGHPLDDTQDKNWAAFVGTELLRILQYDEHRLAGWPPEDRTLLREGICLPALSAIKRDVRVGYTNVVMMTLYLLLGAGKLLNDSEIRKAGEEKLGRMMRFTRTTGSFEEYNSPTYSGIVLPALVSLADLEKDGPLAGDTRKLLEMFVRHLSLHYHAPTGELGGPHSRAYADTLRQRSHLPVYLYSGGVPRPDGPLPGLDIVPGVADGYPAAVPGLDLPPSLYKAFTSGFRKPVETRELVEWVGRDVSLPAPENELPRFRMTTTYREKTFVLGSVNELDVWTQRRNVLANWRAGSDSPVGVKLEVVFKCRHLEENFSYGLWPLMMGIETLAVQDGPRILGAILRCDAVRAKKGDVLKMPSAYMGIGREKLLLPKDPAGWLLGTHWRQPIEKGDEKCPVESMEIAFSAIGAGAWCQIEADLFEFIQGNVRAVVRAQANVSGTRLVLLSLKDFEWDWFGEPNVIVPFSLIVGDKRAGVPPQVKATMQDKSLVFLSGDMELTRKRVAAPDRVEDRTWFGKVDGKEILPPKV
jgi:hypothetical protein